MGLICVYGLTFSCSEGGQLPLLACFLFRWYIRCLLPAFSTDSPLQFYACMSISDPFRNEFVFYGKGLLAPRPTPKMEDHLLSFGRGCLFNIFAANLQLEDVPSIRNPRTRQEPV
jgi:hypothetical protein